MDKRPLELKANSRCRKFCNFYCIHTLIWDHNLEQSDIKSMTSAINLDYNLTVI